MLASLWLPILLSGVALFFASFVSWMVVKLHKDDWKKLPQEDDFLATAAKCNIPVGSYMFPGINHPSEMNNPEFQRKYEAGPRGVLTVLPKANMGVNLGLTFAYFLVVSLGLGYLASLGVARGADFLTVFCFVFTAGLFIFLAAIVQHAIWFRTRIVGHVIESPAYAAIAAATFAALWPA